MKRGAKQVSSTQDIRKGRNKGFYQGEWETWALGNTLVQLITNENIILWYYSDPSKLLHAPQILSDLYDCNNNVTRIFPSPPSYCVDLYRAECISGSDVANRDHNGLWRILVIWFPFSPKKKKRDVIPLVVSEFGALCRKSS